MKIAEFVEGFNSVTDKDKYVKKHITSTYMKYEDKVSEAKRIIDSTLHIKTEDNESVFCYQTPNRYLLFIISIIKNYTDLEFGDEYLSDFNLIEQYNISAHIVKQIGDDYQRFQTVLDMVYDDVVRNERDIVSYIDRKLEAMLQVFDAIANIPKEGDVNGEP